MGKSKNPQDKQTSHTGKVMNDFNKQVIDEFRANHGKVGGNFEGAPLLLLTTIGAANQLRRQHMVRGPAQGQDRGMRAVTWQGKRNVGVEEVPDPQIIEPTDAIIKITSTAICGSDLHLYEVMTPFMEKGDI